MFRLNYYLSYSIKTLEIKIKIIKNYIISIKI